MYQSHANFAIRWCGRSNHYVVFHPGKPLKEKDAKHVKDLEKFKSDYTKALKKKEKQLAKKRTLQGGAERKKK
jgi:hypothetical protein